MMNTQVSAKRPRASAFTTGGLPEPFVDMAASATLRCGICGSSFASARCTVVSSPLGPALVGTEGVFTQDSASAHGSSLHFSTPGRCWSLRQVSLHSRMAPLLMRVPRWGVVFDVLNALFPRF